MTYPGVPRDPTAVIGRRIVAFIIDFVLVWAVVIVAFVALAKSYQNAPSDACQILRDQGVSAPTCIQSGSHVYVLDGGKTATLWLVGIGVWLINNVFLQGATGASVGKFMLGLRVVNGQGETCGTGRAFVRSILLIVDQFFCFLVGIITVNVTHPHQRVGDLVAKTYVVAVSDVGTPIAAPVPVGAWTQQAPPAQWGQPQQPPAWGEPQQQPPPYGQQQPPPWGTPPADAPSWGTPAAPPPPPPPSWQTQAPQAAPPPPQPSWGAPPATETAPAPAPAPASWGAPPPPEPAPEAEPAPPPAQPSSGESWWDRAVHEEGDDEPKQ